MVYDNCTDTLHGMGLSRRVTMSLTWRGWFQDGKRLMMTEFSSARIAVGRVGTVLGMWCIRARTRRDLASLDARMLADIGMTREQATREICKPFWRK